MKSLNTKIEISTARYQQSIQLLIKYCTLSTIYVKNHCSQHQLHFRVTVTIILFTALWLLLKKNAAWNLINHGGWIWTSQVCACKKLRVWKQKEVSLVTFVITQLNHKHPVWARVTRRVLTSTLTRFILYFLNPSPRIW